MNILIITATSFEIAALQNLWAEGKYQQTLSIKYLVAGVGPVLTTLNLSEALQKVKPDLILNLGLAGALDPLLQLGEVVHVIEEQFGDWGVEEANGAFTSQFALGLTDPNEPPFTDGKLVSVSDSVFAKQVTGVTVSTVHGEAASIRNFKSRCDAQVESMEGAAVSLIALRQNLPHIQLRAISNYVEPRNRAGWKIELALQNLTQAADQLLSALPGAVAARSARQQLGL